MSKSIHTVRKRCEWCGAEFIAQKRTTKFCSHRCSGFAYKDKKRRQEVALDEMAFQEGEKQRVIEKSILSVKETATLLGISTRAVYGLLYRGTLAATRLSSRMTRIKRSDIDAMLDANPYQRREREIKPITDFYTSKEVMELLGVGNSGLYKIANTNHWPKMLHRGRTLWSKRHVDSYKVKRDAKRREKELSDQAEYLTVPEAMAKYGCTRDQLDHYLKTYDVRRVKEGRIIRILKIDLDPVFAPPIL
ncbi:MAG: helix-turn-helix domain-containing protein [Bacteroidales bacterium]|nr:helix-turn-helix domain-containing protein [Bacteroidales bacterium]